MGIACQSAPNQLSLKTFFMSYIEIEKHKGENGELLEIEIRISESRLMTEV